MYGGYIYIYGRFYIYMVKVMWRIIYIDRVVLYIYEKRVEDLMIGDIMVHITKSLYFISFTLFEYIYTRWRNMGIAYW